MLIIEKCTPQDPRISALLQASQSLMNSLYAEGDNFALDTDAYNSPDITLFSARNAEKILGIAALKDAKTYGELKSLYTTETARNQGVASALLRQVEDEARALNLPILHLETGEELIAAIRLYENHGFQRCAAFGDYTENGVSVFMEKPLL